MDNDSVVEQIVRSLSFEVEAIPQDNVIHLTTSTKSAPLNVKIRVRKKEEAGFKHGVMSLPKPDRPDSIPERVRLVSSDQTIMSFNVVMEADFQKPVKKPRKNILGIFKPTMCLGAQPDEDDYAYLPSNSYTASINKESTSKSEGALTKFTLSKSIDSDDMETTTLPKRKKDIFGKCKPGGCLDPPFGEDKQPYLLAKNDEKPTKKDESVTKTHRPAESTAERARTSSVFSTKFFNWKRKSSDVGDDNVIKTETEPVLDLYQAGSLQASTTFSNSIMTYPPTLNSSEQLLIQEEKQRNSRIYDDLSKNSFNEHSGSYFIMPRKLKTVLDKNANVENGSDLKVETIHTKSEQQSIIFTRQDSENDETKDILRTNDSVTDDKSSTKEQFIESSGSKISHELAQTESMNMSSQKPENLSISNLNFIPGYVRENQISVKNDMESTIELEKTMIADEISLSMNKSNIETDTTIENTQRTLVDNKTSDFDTLAFATDSNIDLTSQEETITSGESLDHDELIETPTPIERDTPLNLMNIVGDDLQHVWQNMITNPLTSDTNLGSEKDNITNEFNNQSLDNMLGKESVEQTLKVLSEDSLNEHDHKKLTQDNEIISIISQITAHDHPISIIEHNPLLAEKAHLKLDKIDEIDSVASQNVEDILLVRQMSNTSLNSVEDSVSSGVSEFATNSDTEQSQINVEEDIRGTQDISQHAKTSEAGNEQTQLEASLDGANVVDNSNNELNQNNDEISVNKEYTTNQDLELNVDKKTEETANQNQPNNIIFDKNLNKASSQTNLLSKFNLNSKSASQRTETGTEIPFDRRFSNPQSTNETQTPEVRSIHTAVPILLHLGIQSYVNDEKNVIIKTFDSEIAPQRYPNDFVRITKRSLDTVDEIQIPIDSKNDLYVQIKRNTEKNISGTDKNNVDLDLTKKLQTNKYGSEIDHIKRNVIIADDIRRTLEEIYEKELLPLRNTISELKENMEILTMQHMVLKGHIFVKKPRSSKIVPVFRKCGCMRK